MRTILVLAGGRESDKAVFATALSAANPLGAHLEFLHVRISAGEAAAYTPHIEFASGTALHAAFSDLREAAKTRSAAALHHFEELCETELIEIAIHPAGGTTNVVTASWSEEHDYAVARISQCARHNDLVVIGRPSRANGLPIDLVERLLTDSGRPILIAPAKARERLTGIALVFWKETAESARALAAALPLLRVCKRVIIVSVQEDANNSPESLDHLAQRLEWNGIKVETKWVRADTTSTAFHLEAVATEVDADILVMGGYGHGRLREMVFGGCTRQFIDQPDRPVLLMH
jgi:nucleotide-binding universal stress UspA family protein